MLTALLRRGGNLVTSSLLSILGSKTFGFRSPVVPATTQFMVGAPANVVAIPGTLLPSATPQMALGGAGSTTEGGYLATVEPNFVVAGTPVAGLTITQIDGYALNAIPIMDVATNEPVETPTGEQVLALVHALTGSADGDAIAGVGVENLQFSFVYWSKAIIPVLTAYVLPAGTYYFEPRINRTLALSSYISFLTGGDPLPDLLTQVFHVPTFTGLAYTGFPLGSVVVADDTGRLRVVGPTNWVLPGNYLGEFATNRLAHAYIQATFLDTNNDGTGLPREGHWFKHTGKQCERTFDATEGLWRGQPKFGVALGGAETIYVRSGGSDVDGDGATVGTAYATPMAAAQDLPESDWGGSWHAITIDMEEDGASFEIRGTLDHKTPNPRVILKGIDPVEDTTVFLGATGTDTINAVVADSRTGDRIITMNNPDGWVANEWKGRPIVVNDGAAAGSVGYIKKNDAVDELTIVLRNDAFGNLAPGDSITVYRYGTTITGPAGGGMGIIRGGWRLEDLILDVESTFLQLEPTLIDFWDCYVQGGSLSARYSGRVRTRRVYIHNTTSAQANLELGTHGCVWEWDAGPSVLDGWSGGAAQGWNSNFEQMKWIFNEEFEVVDVDYHFVAPSIEMSTPGGTGTYIRLVDCGHWLEILDGTYTGYSLIRLPDVLGQVTDNYWAMTRPLTEHLRDIDIRIGDDSACDTNGATTNRFYIGAAEGYFDNEHNIKVIGTGNAEILIKELELWIGGPVNGAAAPPGANLSFLETMNFAAAGGQDIVGDFKLLDNFWPGYDLEMEFEYATDLAAGNDVELTTSAALFRPGTEIEVNPPANLEVDAARAVPESGVANRVEVSPRIPLTDGAGDINGLEPSVGDRIAIQVARDVGDPSASVFRMQKTARVYMVGV